MTADEHEPAPGEASPDLRRASRRRGRTRPRRRLRDRFQFRRAMFVLPNLFTASSIFCGFYALTLLCDAPEPHATRRAALAILFGMFFDMFDGRVARLTRTQSEFGVQLDSLADVISFGAAPGFLLWRIMLEDLGLFGLVVAFVFVACGAIRLARFNVLAARESAKGGSGGGGGKYFVGLPIPLAAGAVVALVLATFPYSRAADGCLVLPLLASEEIHLGAVFAVVTTLALGGLMVSTLRYQTFKKLNLTPRVILVVGAIVTAFFGVSALTSTPIALAALFGVYLASGIIDGIVAQVQKRSSNASEALAARKPPP